jgi:hypothetical protein
MRLHPEKDKEHLRDLTFRNQLLQPPHQNLCAYPRLSTDQTFGDLAAFTSFRNGCLPTIRYRSYGSRRHQVSHVLHNSLCHHRTWWARATFNEKYIKDLLYRYDAFYFKVLKEKKTLESQPFLCRITIEANRLLESSEYCLVLDHEATLASVY